MRSFKEELIFLLHLLRETRSLNLWVALLSTGGLAACLHIFFFSFATVLEELMTP